MNAKETWDDNLMGEAWDLTNGDRRDSYGDPAQVFTAYGAVWTSILGPKLKPGCTIDAADATLMMAGLKLCREAHKIKRDNVVDCHGYLSLHSRVAGLLVKPVEVTDRCTCTHFSRCEGRDCAYCRRTASTTQVYTCDRCLWNEIVTARQHVSRMCSRTNCGGTQSPKGEPK